MPELPEKKSSVPRKPDKKETHMITEPIEGRNVGKVPPPTSEPRKDPPEVIKPTDMKPKEPIKDTIRKPDTGGIIPGWTGKYPPIHISIVRPRDLLLLEFTLINFKVSPGSTIKLSKLQPALTNKPAYVIVDFPQQSIIEEAFYEHDDYVEYEGPKWQDDPVDEDEDLTQPPIRSRISGTSRLVFKYPKGADPIPYTIEGLLGVMREYPLVVAATAKVPDLQKETPNWAFNPNLVLQTSIRYEFGQSKTFSKLKKRYVLSNSRIYKSSSRKEPRKKVISAESQYALTTNAMHQTYVKLRAERSQLMAELEKVSNILIEAADVSIAELIKPELLAPTEYETSIEAPFRLILSPNKHAAWAHALNEVVSTRQILYSIYPAAQQVVKTIKVKSGFTGEVTEALQRIDKTPGESPAGLASKSMAEKGIDVKQPSEQAEIKQLLKASSLVSKSPIAIDNIQLLYENVDWVELWHTRLGTRVNDSIDETVNPLRTVRGIWAKDARFKAIIDKDYPKPFGCDPPSPDDTYRTSLDAFDRFNIVHLSANFRLLNPDTTRYKPLAIPVERMMLSGLGSWLNLRGVWDPTPRFLGVEEWRHRSTMARDHYVRVVYRGYLFPFGHRASLIKVTERKFHNSLTGKNTAYMRQRMFIVVREPERLYPQTNIIENGIQYDLAFPFTRVRIITLVTPLLAKPEDSAIAGRAQQLFRPRVGATGFEFRFQVIAEDLEGREVEFSLPMVFVGKPILDEKFETARNLIKAVQWDYTGLKPSGMTGGPPSSNLPAAPADLMSQAVCFAPSLEQGDTTLNTELIWFGANVPNVEGNYNALNKLYSSVDTPMFYPRLEKASAHIPAIQHLAGNDGVAEFKYPDEFLINGFEAGNEGGLFAELIDTLPLEFSNQSQRSGGLVSPDININSLSRKYGPVGGEIGNLGEMVSDSFNPKEFFDGRSPMLFGVINLFELVDAVGGPPKFISKAMTPLQGLFQNLQNLQSTLETLGEVEPNLQILIEALETLLNTAITEMGEIILKITSTELSIDALVILVSDLQDSLDALDLKITEVKTALNASGIPASVRIVLEDALSRVQAALQDLLGGIIDVYAFIDRLIQLNQLITEQKITLDWNKELNNWPSDNPIFEGEDGNKAKLNLHAEVDGKSSQKGTPAFTTSCGLHKFNLNLIGKPKPDEASTSFMILKFDKVEFVYNSGSKADVNVEFGGIQFVGVLSFVEALKTLIPLNGFSDPPGLDISAEGITASYSLALPNLAIGVFSMTNMSLAAGFSIPFIGDPLSVWFGFCTRENPFNLTVSMFGGGGFFAITLQPNGLKCLEASFEFGASISVDFGVASGGVHAMAGIYFKMEMNDEGNLAAQLTGYFRMGGFLSVLGIISVSIELYLSLTYEPDTGKCTGVAELTIEVEVLFFSVSVKVRAERKFSGSNGDPTFAELMESYAHPVDGSLVDPWETYCKAFA